LRGKTVKEIVARKAIYLTTFLDSAASVTCLMERMLKPIRPYHQQFVSDPLRLGSMEEAPDPPGK
jgi:hypothetical protein